MNDQHNLAGHAFISYVREDSDRVDQLEQSFVAAGIPVWRDTSDLWPGEDWRAKIRRAITDNTLVFIACFSRTSLAREKSYQNEELNLAIDQLRLRRPNDPWLIPVRFDDCEIPDVDIGAGRTLASIQRADLFGDRSAGDAERLVSAILRILGPTAAQASASYRVAEVIQQCRKAFASDVMFSVDQVAKMTGVARRRLENWQRKNWLRTTGAGINAQFDVRALVIVAALNQLYIKKLVAKDKYQVILTDYVAGCLYYAVRDATVPFVIVYIADERPVVETIAPSDLYELVSRAPLATVYDPKELLLEVYQTIVSLRRKATDDQGEVGRLF
jgi:hypothetical protein